MNARSFVNARARGARVAAPSRDPLRFHKRLPGYAPTPLRDAPGLARELGVGRVRIKDESSRLGLPSFKILGASWAVYRALEQRLGHPFGPWSALPELAEQLAGLRPLALAAATDGNHGRAVARMAALLGLEGRIYVPASTAETRIEAIRSEGARVEVVAGGYDDAVARSAEDAGERCLVISDTSWPGYEDVPRWVIDGYSTIFWEIEDELAGPGKEPPDLVLVQIGVGALAAAAVRHYRRPGERQPALVGVEPNRAACVLASLEAGEIVTIPGPQDSIMVGLNCGTPSMVAWPEISSGIDLTLAIGDENARDAMRRLARTGVVAGETGAAGTGGLLPLLGEHAEARAAAGIDLDGSTSVLVLCTEGATDPGAYEEIVGPRAAATA